MQPTGSGKVVSFEVYSLVSGRWELGARHGADGQEAAIGEARELHKAAHVKAVKVVKEVYNPADSTTLDVNVYYQAKKRDELERPAAAPALRAPAKPPTPAAPELLTAAPESGVEAERLHAQPPERKRATAAIALPRDSAAMKRLAVVAAGAIVAGFAAAAAVRFALESGGISPGSFFGSLPAAGSALSLMFLVAGLGMTIMRRGAEAAAALDADPGSIGDAERPGGVPDWLASPAQREVQTAEVELLHSSAAPPVERHEREAQAAQSAEIIAELTGDELPRAERTAAPAADDGRAALGGDDLTAVEARVVKDATVEVMKFMSACLTYALRNSPHARGGSLDPYSIFGCSLYLAGAADGYCRRRRFDQRLVLPVTETCSGVLQSSPERARRFAQRYEEHLLDEKNQEMFRSGAQAMGHWAQGETDGVGRYLVWALDAWSQKRTAPRQPVAVMLTGIVGSGQAVRESGDAESQRLVAAHNAIVRESLRFHGGREVKQTGDGIMASFSDPAKAPHSAVAILRGVAMHNQMNPGREMHLRIGINSGAPIEDGGEALGATVQIATQLCQLARADEILVSDPQRLVSDAKGVGFVDRGHQEMKGFKDALQVFAVPWSDADLRRGSGAPSH